jgi:pimeloyl-ACP methyl ester carboxylesterase
MRFRICDPHKWLIRTLSGLFMALSFSLSVSAAQVATPIFNTSPGTYVSSVSVSISCPTAGANIRYTTNGSVPTSGSAPYNGPLNLTSSTTLKAKAFKSGFTESPVATATYTLVVATPVLSRPTATYTGVVSVTISCATGGATIRYTINGSNPTSSSPVYSGVTSLAFTSTTVLKAKAFKTGLLDSGTVTATYTILQQVATPTFSQPPGLFIGTGTVSFRISCATSGATIKYTTDGSDPTSSSSTYFGILPFNFTSDTTLKAKAFKSGMADSAIAVGRYSPAILLLLHGLNSDPSTWSALVGDVFNGGSQSLCPEFTLSSSLTTAHCYRYHFMSRVDSRGDTWPNGDGATYTELGVEVGAAVRMIADRTRPAAIFIVGHSRGGLAARAYLQTINFSSTYKIGLLTIGTPHQGSPFGRMKVWMDHPVPADPQHPNGFTWRDLNFTYRNLFKFVFSPSTGYLATDHDANQRPIRSSISAAIFALNDRAGTLGSKAVAFGQIYSTGLRMGENAVAGFNLLDGTSVAGILPGSLNDQRSFILKNLPDDWKNNGDGLVPAASQQLSQLPGFSFGPGVLTTVLNRISHTNETGQTAVIKTMLNNMAARVQISSTFAPSSVQEGEGEYPGAQELQTKMKEVSVSLSAQSSDQVVSALLQALRAADELTLNAAQDELVARSRKSSQEVVDLISRRLVDSTPTEKGEFISLIGQIGSQAALKVLIEIALDKNHGVTETQSFALAEISRIGLRVPQGESAEALEAILEGAFAGISSERLDALEALATGLSTLGTPEGVETLFNYLEANGVSTEASERVIAALRNVQNAAAAKTLARRLRRDPSLLNQVTLVAGDVLAAMGRSEATESILRWAADARSARQIEQATMWLSQIRDTASLELLSAYLNSNRFQDPQMKSMLAELADRLSRQFTPSIIKPQ